VFLINSEGKEPPGPRGNSMASGVIVDTHAELGAGGYGKVFKAKRGNETIAAKQVSKSRMKMSAIQREIDLMTHLGNPGHKNLIQFFGSEEVGKHIVIYMELANNGELFSKVIDAGALTEDEAMPYFKQLMQAVQYMHSKGVAHRDLKLENVLLHQNECKVCDFGLAHHYDVNVPPTLLREVCGSKSYCAPEVLKGEGYYGYPTDVWSCGICLFAMLAGFFPLDEASGADWRFERVKMAAAANASVTHTIFGFYERPCTLSAAVTDLIDGMLTIDPTKRLSVEQVLNSQWLSAGKAPATYRGGQMGQFNEADLKMLLAQESEEQHYRPVYRGVKQKKGEGPPPMLSKQHAFPIHVEDA